MPHNGCLLLRAWGLTIGSCSIHKAGSKKFQSGARSPEATWTVTDSKSMMKAWEGWFCYQLKNQPKKQKQQQQQNQLTQQQEGKPREQTLFYLDAIRRCCLQWGESSHTNQSNQNTYLNATPCWGILICSKLTLKQIMAFLYQYGTSLWQQLRSNFWKQEVFFKKSALFHDCSGHSGSIVCFMILGLMDDLWCW